MQFIALCLTLILFLLSLFHVYWAMGGTFGLRRIIPTIDGKMAFKPHSYLLLLMAAFLFFLASTAFVLGFTNLSSSRFFIYCEYTAWLWSSLFFLRAIGDFNFFGFFKQVRGSAFARYDSYFYSPLCLFISLSFLLLST